MNITYRPMRREDVPRIAELERICFRTPWSEQALMGEVRNELAHYLVGEAETPEGGKIITYAGMWLLFGEAHITNVAVDPGFRGQGLGKRTMLEMMRLAKKHRGTRMTLEVRETNSVAQTLYLSLGFAIAGKRKRYYTDTGEAAYIMWNDDIAATLHANPSPE